jgi:predicted restriction endonuclease
MVTIDTSPASVHAGPAVAGEELSMPAGSEAPIRRATTTQRLVRSIQVAEYVKALHEDTCQACGTRLVIGTRCYSEGAHIRALGSPHDGPDVPANVLCLCPNCHVLFDNGALLINDDLHIAINGQGAGVLRTDPRHLVDRAHVAYHRSVHQ